MPPVLTRMAGGLIVSCQARADNPLYGPAFMAAIARAAEAGGAAGLRMNGPDDIRAACHIVSIPIIGLFKRRCAQYAVEITPTFAEAAGADAVATTLSGYLNPAVPPPDEPDLDLVSALAGRLGVPVIAEGRIRTPAQARAALDRGAYAVVVGTAITNPREITRWYIREMTA